MKTGLLNGCICFLLCGWCTSFMTGCNDVENASVEKTIYVDINTLNIFFGDKIQITASPTGETFEWKSEDPAVAVVAGGLVEAVGVGVTNIIVSSQDGVRSLIPVTVTIPTVDGVIVRPGNRRVQFNVRIESDRIKTVKVTWDERGTSKSVTHNVNFQSGVFPIYATGLEEKNYTFTLTCTDGFDNESVPVEVTGKAYGDVFEATLQNRPVKGAYPINGVKIMWGASSGALYSELKYMNAGGQICKIIPASENITVITDYMSGLQYSTYFLPELLAVDTFSVAFDNLAVDVYFNGPHVLSSNMPLILPARDFDIGGEGVAYHDTTAGNSGGNAYRLDNGDIYNDVDVEYPGIGYVANGEWLLYTVDVHDAGDYAVDIQIAGTNNGKYYFIVDEVPQPSCNVESTGGWGTWRWLYTDFPALIPEQPVLNLTAGRHKIKFYVEASGYNIQAYKFTYKP
ncbi:MAG: DUF5010 C-terminal domain-containing protein [Tannerella sp.]|nr:DUF5010 C-terminal domain-containing protein [Tannerella sp.]